MAPRSAHRVAALALAGLIGAATLGAPHLPHVSAGVLAAFDGAPAAPQPFSQHAEYAAYDVQTHSLGEEPWASLPAMQAQHGPNCSGPPATHPTSSYEDAVYICNDHLMTAINGDGYATVVLTPNRLLDLGSGSVTFELSTQKMSQRDWWDVMISPWAENLALPLLSDLSQGVDLQGPPKNAISIASDNGQGSPVLKVVRNGAVQSYGSGDSVAPLGQGVAAGTNQAAVRQSFRFSAQGGRMKFERLASSTAPALVYWDIAATATFPTGIVQFGHHSYNPDKDGAGTAATWHWDNLTVNGGAPFTILHAAPRQLTDPGTVTFPPAPAGAFLRFSALCRPIVNGVAAAYQPAAEQVQAHHAEHPSSYFVPISAGATSATIGFTNDEWYGPAYGCYARSFHVWAPGAGGPPPPTMTPTLTPPAGTPTATSIPTAPPLATATGVPTVAPTATPTTYRCQRRNPNGSFTTIWTQAGGGSCP